MDLILNDKENMEKKIEIQCLLNHKCNEVSDEFIMNSVKIKNFNAEYHKEAISNKLKDAVSGDNDKEGENLNELLYLYNDPAIKEFIIDFFDKTMNKLIDDSENTNSTNKEKIEIMLKHYSFEKLKQKYEEKLNIIITDKDKISKFSKEFIVILYSKFTKNDFLKKADKAKKDAEKDARSSK